VRRWLNSNHKHKASKTNLAYSTSRRGPKGGLKGGKMGGFGLKIATNL